MKHLIVVVAAVAVAVVAVAVPARAAEIVVNTQAQASAAFPADGLCSIGEAIAAANTDAAVDGCAAGSGADVIRVPAGTYLLPFVIDVGSFADSFAFPSVESVITIAGAGADTTTIERDANAPIMGYFDVVAGSGDLTLTGLTVRLGRGLLGGAVSNHNTATVDGCVFDQNSTFGGGGAVGGATGETAPLVVRNSRFTANNTNEEGGAVSGGSTVVVDNSVFDANTGDGIVACEKNTQCTVTVTSSTFINNVGVDGSIVQAATFDIADSVFVNNDSAFHVGGAVSGSGTIDRCWFEDTTAPTGGAVFGSAIAIRASTFFNNLAFNDNGGAVALTDSTVENCTFFGNNAEGTGGAVESVGGDVALNNVTIIGNSARGGAGGVEHRAGDAVHNTIIAGNTTEASTSPDCAALDPNVTSSFNIVGDASGCAVTAGAGDVRGDTDDPITGANLRVAGVLADNGGPDVGADGTTHVLQTLALFPASPAVDTGDDASCALVDARGVARPVGAGCDRGAFEGALADPCDDAGCDPNAICDPSTTPPACSCPDGFFGDGFTCISEGGEGEGAGGEGEGGEGEGGEGEGGEGEGEGAGGEGEGGEGEGGEGEGAAGEGEGAGGEGEGEGEGAGGEGEGAGGEGEGAGAEGEGAGGDGGGEGEGAGVDDGGCTCAGGVGGGDALTLASAAAALLLAGSRRRRRRRVF